MPDNLLIPQTMESPCTNICVLSPSSGYCIGCGRTMAEITEWVSASQDRQKDILRQLPARMAEIKAREPD